MDGDPAWPFRAHTQRASTPHFLHFTNTGQQEGWEGGSTCWTDWSGTVLMGVLMHAHKGGP